MSQWLNGWYTDTLGGIFKHAPWGLPLSLMKLLLWQKNNPVVLGLLKCWIIRISKLLDVLLKEFCSIIILYNFFCLLSHNSIYKFRRGADPLECVSVCALWSLPKKLTIKRWLLLTVHPFLFQLTTTITSLNSLLGHLIVSNHCYKLN